MKFISNKILANEANTLTRSLDGNQQVNFTNESKRINFLLFQFPFERKRASRTFAFMSNIVLDTLLFPHFNLSPSLGIRWTRGFSSRAICCQMGLLTSTDGEVWKDSTYMLYLKILIMSETWIGGCVKSSIKANHVHFHTVGKSCVVFLELPIKCNPSLRYPLCMWTSPRIRFNKVNVNFNFHSESKSIKEQLKLFISFSVYDPQWTLSANNRELSLEKFHLIDF